MQTTLKNRKKVVADFPRNALKRKNRVEEGGASSSGVKREHENKDLKAQKVMRGKVEPSTVPTVVEAVGQITVVPQMTSPQERQPREQRHEIP